MKVYTKTGDDGTTQLLGGTRVAKDDARLCAYGAVDELNAWVGHLALQPGAETHAAFLQAVQHHLFTIGSHLANDPTANKQFPLPELPEAAILALEESIDALDTELPPLKNFVLPGGHPANTTAHLARTVCRRAERNVIALRHHAPVEPRIVVYLNRLSDWCFVFARFLSLRNGAPETPWKPRG